MAILCPITSIDLEVLTKKDLKAVSSVFFMPLSFYLLAILPRRTACMIACQGRQDYQCHNDPIR